MLRDLGLTATVTVTETAQDGEKKAPDGTYVLRNAAELLKIHRDCVTLEILEDEASEYYYNSLTTGLRSMYADLESDPCMLMYEIWADLYSDDSPGPANNG